MARVTPSTQSKSIACASLFWGMRALTFRPRNRSNISAQSAHARRLSARCNSNIATTSRSFDSSSIDIISICPSERVIMPRASMTMANSANSRGHETDPALAILATQMGVNAVISAVLKIKEPRKTWGFLAGLLFPKIELTESVAKHRLAGRRDYTTEELQTLLQSEEGLDFLIAVMGNAQPAWWRWMTRVMTLAAVRRRQAEDAQQILKLETSGDVDVGARRRIKGALDADKRLSSAIARAETTLGFSRPNVDRMGAADDSRNARISHRSLAQAKGRR